MVIERERNGFTLCLVDWNLSPGLPRPMRSHGLGHEENDGEGDDEEEKRRLKSFKGAFMASRGRSSRRTNGRERETTRPQGEERL